MPPAATPRNQARKSEYFLHKNMRNAALLEKNSYNCESRQAGTFGRNDLLQAENNGNMTDLPCRSCLRCVVARLMTLRRFVARGRTVKRISAHGGCLGSKRR